MNKCNLLFLVMAGALITGCSSKRSISHSGYPQQGHYCSYGIRDGASDPAFDYRGELSEFDVLGVTRSEFTSEADIQRAVKAASPVKLRSGSAILLIQSGALFPDGPMVSELSKHFRVIPFSGVPVVRKTPGGIAHTESSDPENYSRSLRLAAARGGAEFIVCYWGMLESESDRLATKTVSWVPVVHWVVPDEKQRMHIQLKVAVVEVRSGNWTLFSPSPFDDARLSAAPRRGAVDQKQVERLKKLAYEASVKELVQGIN